MPKNNSQKQNRVFNLLKPQVAPLTAWDKIYDWLLGKARVVMVIAEILVALAFVGKVIVDIDAKNLDDRITVSKRELDSVSSVYEPEIRKLQQKAFIYQELWNTSPSYSPILNELHQYVPFVTANLNIRISAKEVTVQGGQNINLLSQIEAGLKQSQYFTNVAISSLTAEGVDVATGQASYILTAEIRDIYNRTPIGSGESIYGDILDTQNDF